MSSSSNSRLALTSRFTSAQEGLVTDERFSEAGSSGIKTRETHACSPWFFFF
jgi:hypothetical protein